MAQIGARLEPEPGDLTPVIGSATDISPLGRAPAKPHHEQTADEEADVVAWDQIAATAEFRALKRGLRSRRFADAVDDWRTLAGVGPAPASAPERPLAGVAIEAVAGDRIRSVHRRMVRDGSAIDDASPPEALHDLRKRVKDLRYAAQVARPVAPKRMRKLAKRANALADLIGDDHDLAVLREAAAERSATLTGDELAHLRELIDQRRARLQKRALKAAERLYTPKPRRIARLVERAEA